MIHAAMTAPAVAAISVDFKNHLPVAADTIFLNRMLAVGGNRQFVGIQTAVEKYHILGAVVSFPHYMIHEIIIRQVTFHAVEMAMVGIFQPGVMLVLHDMAGGAELRRGSLMIEPRRPEKYKEKQEQGDSQSPQNAHTFATD